MGGRFPGDDQEPGGVLVEPVDDPGPLRVLPAPGQIPERLDQGGAGIAGRRVDDQAGRLVDHRQELVLPDDPGAEGHRDSGSGPGGSPVWPASGSAAPPESASGWGPNAYIQTRMITPSVISTSARLNAGQASEIDEIGDGTLVDPVDQVADRAAGEQPDRKPEPAAIRCREEHAEQGCEGDRGEHEHERAGVVEQAEGDPAVADPDDVEAGDDVDPFAGHQLAADHRLGDLIERERDERNRRRPTESGG